MQSLLSSIFTASACLHFAAASAMYTESFLVNIETRATFNCTDLRADPSTRCWDDLDISDYLAAWNRTTPTCQGKSGDYDCCNPQEPWTTCFLRLAYGDGGSDCTVLEPQLCLLRPLSPDLSSNTAPKVGYVVRNILVINNLFVSYFGALQSQGNNISESDSESANLHRILGGKNQVGAMLNNGNVAKALVAGLPFWGMPSVLASGPQQINPHVNVATAKAFARSLQNTNAVSSLLLGTPYNSNDYMITENDLAFNLGEAETLLKSALSLIMSDMPTFSDWADHGLYSGATTSMTIPPVAIGLTSAFTTYLVGEALSQIGFSATPTSTTLTKAEFQQSRTCTTLGDVCKDSDGKAYYLSPTLQIQYEINEPKAWALGSSTAGTGNLRPVIQQLGYEVSAYGLLEYIETSDVYMPVLFDGAYNCTLEGKAGGSAVNINADGSLDVACLSSLPIYLSKSSPCPTGAVQVGGKCPFGFNGW